MVDIGAQRRRRDAIDDLRTHGGEVSTGGDERGADDGPPGRYRCYSRIGEGGGWSSVSSGKPLPGRQGEVAHVVGHAERVVVIVIVVADGRPGGGGLGTGHGIVERVAGIVSQDNIGCSTAHTNTGIERAALLAGPNHSVVYDYQIGTIGLNQSDEPAVSGIAIIQYIVEYPGVRYVAAAGAFHVYHRGGSGAHGAGGGVVVDEWMRHADASAKTETGDAVIVEGGVHVPGRGGLKLVVMDGQPHAGGGAIGAPYSFIVVPNNTVLYLLTPRAGRPHVWVEREAGGMDVDVIHGQAGVVVGYYPVSTEAAGIALARYVDVDWADFKVLDNAACAALDADAGGVLLVGEQGTVRGRLHDAGIVTVYHDIV